MLVTGAGAGLGRALALQLARAGYPVIAVGRTQSKLESLYDQILTEGGQASLCPMQLGGVRTADLDALAAGIEQDFGRLAGIVHAAVHFHGLTDMRQTDPREWAKAHHVNATLPLILTQACFDLLTPDARVVVFDDRHRQRNPAFWGAYAASKASLVTAFRAWQIELRSTRPDLLVIETPPPMRTALWQAAFVQGTDESQLARPADIAESMVAGWWRARPDG